MHDGPVVLVWGANHLPGMGDVLERNDFRLTETRWVRAIGRTGRPTGNPAVG